MGAQDKEKHGGAESFARFKQYDYRANSSLVLTSDTRTRDSHEPSGEPETLWGRLSGRMGDRVQHEKPEGYGKRKEKLKKKRDKEANDLDFGVPKKKNKLGQGVSVLDVETAVSYRPKTRETHAAYEGLLALVRSMEFIGDQPQDVLHGTADEVLKVLKYKGLGIPERKGECEDLLGPISDEKFAEMVQIGKLITDYTLKEDVVVVEGLDEEMGVAVEFEDEEEEEEEEVDEVVDTDRDDDEEGKQDTGQHADIRTSMDVDAGEEEREEGLKVQEIDAYWLQRRISRAFGSSDADAMQKLSGQVLDTLALDTEDDREVENRLVRLLDFDKFDLIKELLLNRLKILWCTKLSRADGEEERQNIEKEMEDNPGTQAILQALHATRTSAKERQRTMERNIREEARKLREGEKVQREEGRAAVGGPAPSRHMLDLESLSFRQGGHFMSNKSCQLPHGSYRRAEKGYEEVHVPALKPKPMKDGELRPITDLPDWCQPAFQGMKTLNRVQSGVCDTALFTSENILMCAPTGAGKTNVAMLCVLHELGLHRRLDGSIETSSFKIVYIAPMKALVAEMVGNFCQRLGSYGIKVRELTGDINLTKAEIEDTQIIVTTPEKWDIITRKSDDRTYVNLVRLLIIDEIHLLHDDRGPVLESVVARTIRQIEATQEMTRIVGLSATLPNYEDVAAFLRVNPKKGVFFFDNSNRPCPLAQQYIGVTVKKPLQRFQLMNEVCYQKVLECAGKHQVLVFVHSRKETVRTARFIKDMALKEDMLVRFIPYTSASKEVLQEEAAQCKDSDLRDLLPFGFGIHHAGMNRVDRTLVEELFADKHIQVLVSTATLAWGVNLPAHTVVIKGTQIYNPVKAAWTELSPQDVMQMMGRAGRPQYDSQGEGIIITGHPELQFYLSLFNQQLPIESQYIERIPDNLNAEVVLGTIQSLKDASNWLGYTYLYVRMLRSPQLYGVSVGALEADNLLLERRMDLAHSAAVLLDKHNLLKYDRKSGNFQVTDLGRIASHYYVSYTTIATYSEHLKPTMGDIELMRLFSLADEFRYMVVREEEKLELVKLIERVPIPIKESLDEPTAKINVLLQAYISNLKLEGLALASDMVYITQSAGRLMRCLAEVCLKRGWASLTEKALNLTNMINHRMWGSQSPLRQFKGVQINHEILTKLEKRDIPWEQYYDLSSQELGELIRMPKAGKTLHKLVHQFPKLELAAHVQPITRTILKLDLSITPDFQWEDKLHGHVEPWWILVEDQDGETLVHHQYWILKKQLAEEQHTVTFTVPISEPVPPQYFIKVVSDRWLQCKSCLPVSFRHLILPEKYPPPTELLDLQPLPVSALRNPSFEALYDSFTHFNPIQTQVFTALYNTDDNALVAAPTGSGKTICAEFAILRMLQKAADGKCPARCVYIGPIEPIMKERMADWTDKFGKGLGLLVVELTGETAVDLKLLEKGNIILSTSERWDMLSRRWKQRKNVQEVALFIADELHLIGGSVGPVLEVVMSRMRYISSQLDNPIRIVGLASSLANAKDLGDWIGATSHGLFNFPPTVRPVPLEIKIQGFDIINFDARMQAMSRPAYSSICSQAAGHKPAVIFVPTRKHARLAALDLLTFAAADGEPHKFCPVDDADIEPLLGKVRDQALKHSLRFGVGILHETMSPAEQNVVDVLFATGAVQVVVATASMCWSMSPKAHLVVIMGTQYFDSSGLSNSDYPIYDLLQMLGRASRPPSDAVSKCVLMCHAPRKEYYKKFLFEPLPVESHVDHFLHDHLVAEIVTKTVTSAQDAVDWLTWTFYYRRLAQNPNYYNLTGMTHRHISDHLSDLVENTLRDLEQSKVIAVDGDMELSALNAGLIAHFFYISYTTIELFCASFTAKTKLKGLLEIISNASEFSHLPLRPGEAEAVKKLLMHAPVAVDQPKYSDPHTKSNALLQAHFSRSTLLGDLGMDQTQVVKESVRLLQAAVDVVATNNWLHPALTAMEMSQMVTQAMWEKDSVLMQLPHFTPKLCSRCDEAGVSNIFDLLDMEDHKRRELLQLSDKQLEDVAVVCNRYPDINFAFELLGGSEVASGEEVPMQVKLEREVAGDLPPVHAPRFPGRKDETWWLVVGEPKANALLGIKRVALGKTSQVKLSFLAPSQPGKHELRLFFMCDSYLGCDQEYDFTINVTEAVKGDSDSESD